MNNYTSNDDSETPISISPELIKSYVEYYFKAEIINSSYFYTKGQRVTIVDFTHEGHTNHKYYVYAYWGNDMWDWIPLRDIIPVLRPFSALCKPLPDGTIPSVEIANLIREEPNFHNASYLALIIKNNLSIEDSIGIYLPSVDCVSVISYYDWWGLYEKEDDIIPYKVYEYLYQNSFAVDLKRHQFIEAV